MSSGQLILLIDEIDASKNVIYEPVNNILHVGSETTANVCLSGLKNIAFTIFIDNCGRVHIQTFMKKIQINGKRVSKNNARPIMNNTTIVAGEHRFLWKYNSMFTKSYSLSPCKRNAQDVEMIIRNRKTINCFAVKAVNDENISSTVPHQDEEANTHQMPVITPVKSGIIVEKGKTPSNGRTSLIPVKSNRTSELRRASIVRSKSVSYDVTPFQYKTPKKPIPSASMAKSVNALIRSASYRRDREAIRAGQRKSLGASLNSSKSVDNANFPKIVDSLNLFTVVTDEMKSVGPSAYLTNKFGASNSPKRTRTPTKALLKPKRLSLRSELVEMGIMRTKAMEHNNTSAEDEKPAEIDVVSTTTEAQDIRSGSQNTPEETEKDSALPDTLQTETNAASNNLETEVDCISTNMLETDADKVVIVSQFEDKQSTNTSTVERAVTLRSDTETIKTPTSSKRSKFRSTLQSSSSVELMEDTVEFLVVPDSSSDDESSDSDDSIITVDDDTEMEMSETSPETVVSAPTTMNSEEIVNNKSIAIDNGGGQESERMEEQQLNASLEESSEKSKRVSESQFSTISTPTKVLPIRARRNSRLCSLDECCSPSAAFGTPSKSKLVVSTPRSILKTPKTLKTPKKSVRILETILHEEEDDVLATNGLTNKTTTSATEQQQKNVPVENETASVDEEIENDTEDVAVAVKTIETTASSDATSNDIAANLSTKETGSVGEVLIEEQEVTPIDANVCDENETSSVATNDTEDVAVAVKTIETTASSDATSNDIAANPSAKETGSVGEVLIEEQEVTPIDANVCDENETSSVATNDTDDVAVAVKTIETTASSDATSNDIAANLSTKETGSVGEVLIEEQEVTPIDANVCDENETSSVATNDTDDVAVAVKTIETTASSDATSNDIAANLSTKETGSVGEVLIEEQEFTPIDANACDVSTPNSNTTGATNTLNWTFHIDGEFNTSTPLNRAELSTLNAKQTDSAELIDSERKGQGSETLNGTFNVDNGLELDTSTTMATPHQSNETMVEAFTLVEGSTLVDGRINSTSTRETKLSDDATNAIDKSTGRGDVLVNDTMTSSSNERRESNLFDETFDVDIEGIKQEDVTIRSMSVTEQNDQLTDTEEVKNLLNTSKPLDLTNLGKTSDGNKTISDMRGLKELMNTPKPMDKTNLVGMKELLNTPSDDNKTLSDLRGVKELVNTPKPLDKTNLVGMKELLNTPSDGNKTVSDLRGVKELMNTPKPMDKTNLVGMKELLNTPSDGNKTVSDLRGVKELMNTPKPMDKTNLVGMKELLNTPSPFNQSVEMIGVRELLKTPHLLDRTSLIGIKELLRTPAKLNEEDLDGIYELLKTPEAGNVTTNSASSMSSTTSAEADKRYRLSFKFNSRQSLMNLLNNKLAVMGLPTVHDEAEPPEPDPIPEQNHENVVAAQNAQHPENAEVLQPQSDAEAEKSNDNSSIESANAEDKVEPVITVPKKSNSNVSVTQSEHQLRAEGSTSESVGVTGEGSSAMTEDTKLEPVKEESNVSKTQERQMSSTEKLEPQNVAQSAGTEPSDAEHMVSKTPSRTRKRREVEKVESKKKEVQVAENEGVAKTIESKPSTAETKVSNEKDPQGAGTEPSDAEHMVSKTPSRTRKRVEVEKVEPAKEEVTQTIESKPSTAGTKVSKASSKTRKLQASAVEPQECHDEKVSENEEAEAIGVKSRTRRTHATPKPAIPSTAERKLPKNRKRKASEVESLASETESVQSAVESKTQKKLTALDPPTKTTRATRKRKASAVESHDDNVNASESSQVSETESVQSTVESTKGKSAAAQDSSTKFTRGTRKRQVSVAESHDENINASESSQVSEVESVQPTAESKIRKRAAIQDPPTKTTRATRKRKASAVESHDDNVNASESSQVSETESVQSTVESTKGKRAALQDSSTKFTRGTRKRQVSVAESHDENINASESSQVSEVESVQPTAESKIRKRAAIQDPPTKTTRATRKRKASAVESHDDNVNASESSQVSETESVQSTVESKKGQRAATVASSSKSVQFSSNEAEKPTIVGSKRRRRRVSELDADEDSKPSPEKQRRTARLTSKTEPKIAHNDEAMSSATAAKLADKSTKATKGAKATRSRNMSEVETLEDQPKSTPSTRSTRQLRNKNR